MASRSVLRIVFLAEPWLSLPFTTQKRSIFTPIISPYKKISKPFSNCGCRIVLNPKSSHIGRNFCATGNPLSADDDSEQGPPQEAVLKAIAEVSKSEGRIGQTTNMVIGGTVTDDATSEWLELDQKVNSYPTERGFTAIGTGGDDFVQAMIIAVESVILYPIPDGQVKQKISSGGKYVSVNIGPVQVVSSEQVQAVYNAMRRDDRMKYFL